MKAGAGAVAIVASGALLCACAGAPPSPDVPQRPIQLADLAKTDIDRVAEVNLEITREQLRTLMLKLYKRNPDQWRKSGKPSPNFVAERVFRPQRVPDFVELGSRRGADAVHLAFDPGYSGDRVLAFIAGLASMVERAYGERREFYLPDTLDPQKLYNLARNFETAAWLLRTARRPDGRPWLLSYSAWPPDTAGGSGNAVEPRVNMSYERLFGKLVAEQDLIARVVAESTNRTVRAVVHRMVGAVFLPI